MTAAERARAADALARAWMPGDVILISTDLTHYGPTFNYLPFPHDHSTGARLRALDDELIEALSSLDAALFLGALRECSATLCGSQPVALVLETLARLEGEELFAEPLDAQHSGEITGDFLNSVGYGAIGIYPESSFYVAPDAMRALLRSACATVRQLKETGAEHAVEAAGCPELDRAAGVFVSLHAGHELLGCLGRLEPDMPLRQTVPALALDAALRDPRFDPHRKLPGRMEVEVSILTPFKRIADESRFRLREHGALLDYAGRHALLLPQVARERECSSEWFLETLARKAGLAPGAYRNREARLSVFRAQVCAGFDTMEV
jgi:AmmeMemoRadiSam system protein A